MATKTIFDYTAAVSIDGTNDYLLIEQAVGPIYKKINRSTLLGITGSPVGTTDTQTLSAKTLTAPIINGATLSGTLSGTYTIGGTPTFPASITTLTGIQTLTNKTLTSPAINGGTIDNATITVDSIAGHTTSTIVTVGGVQMNNGTIGTSGAVTSTSIAAGAVQPQALVAGTGTGWAWSSWAPTYANLTIGNGTVTAKYVQMGKTVFFIWKITLGSTSAMGTGPTISFPVATNATYNTNDMIGQGFANTSTANGAVWAQWVSSTTFSPFTYSAAGTYVLTQTSFTSAIPGTWGTGNLLTIQGSYEVA